MICMSFSKICLSFFSAWVFLALSFFGLEFFSKCPKKACLSKSVPVYAQMPNLIPFLEEKLRRQSYLCSSAPDIVWRPASRPAPGPLVVRAPRPRCDPPTHIGLSLSGLHPSLLTRQKPGRWEAEEDQLIVLIIRNIQKECIWRHCKSYVWTKTGRNRLIYLIL